jgi:hypothetical protein
MQKRAMKYDDETYQSVVIKVSIAEAGKSAGFGLMDTIERGSAWRCRGHIVRNLGQEGRLLLSPSAGSRTPSKAGFLIAAM